MKTIYLKQERSGNFILSNENEKFDHVFINEESFKEFFKNHITVYYGSRIIKESFCQSKIYFQSADEVIRYCEKH